MKQTGWRLIVKTVVDRTVAACLLAATARILVVAAAAVRVSMGGPVFLRHERLALDGWYVDHWSLLLDAKIRAVRQTKWAAAQRRVPS